MSKLSYRTIADERPQGKPNVFFSCHPEDFDKYFEEYASKILKIQDCAIWYESEPEAAYDKEDLELNLSQMQLFVMPVTTKLLTEPCRAMEVELPLAKEKHIPVLPLMMEQGLDEVFSKLFGDLQYLNPSDRDETRRSFDEVLETYIKSVLVSNELAEKVRAAFDAYIFLSYRKKDRRKAQELMRLIHRSPLCRDIAIWYDEFLTPGEDFNDAIGKMLQKSDLFALVVTPNLVNEINYVMTTEYPAAVEQEKPVLPVEMEETDRGQLDEHYKSLPPCVKGEESEAFSAALLEKIRTMAVEANDTDPGHNFLIGLAYLDGIDVEVDNERAVELITGAAEAGVPEAMEQLVTMYETGKGVTRDYYEGVRWRERYVEYLKKAYEAEPTEGRTDELILELEKLGDAQYTLRNLDAAETAYGDACFVAIQSAKNRETTYIQNYTKLGMIAKAMGNLSKAQRYYEKGLTIAEEQVEKTGTIESKRDLSICYSELGDTVLAMGDIPTAKRYYEKGLAIREELVEETGTIESRYYLSVSYNRLGNIATVMGDLTGAQSYYEKSVAIDEELVNATGSLISWTDLLDSYNELGNIAMLNGNLARAQVYYEGCLAIAEELAEKSGTIASRSDLSLTYERLGNIATAIGNLTGAREYYERSLTIEKDLAEKTGTVESRRSLSICYDRLGDTAAAMGNLALAKGYYEKSHAIREELVEETGTIESRRDLSICYDRLGDIAKAMGNLTSAKGYYEKGHAIREELVEKTGATESKRDLYISFIKLGNIAAAMGNLVMTQVYYEKSLAIAKDLVEKTEAVESRRDLLVCYNRLGSTAAAMGDLLSALSYYVKCLAIAEELSEKTGTLQAHKDLANILFDIGVLYYNEGLSRITAKSLFERIVDLVKDSNDVFLSELGKKTKDILDEYFTP